MEPTRITWAEFVAAVEARGVKSTDEIEYIDMHGFDASPRLNADGGGLRLSQEPDGWRIVSV